jgi:hypothetical protein
MGKVVFLFSFLMLATAAYPDPPWEEVRYGYGSEIYRVDAARAALRDARRISELFESVCTERGGQFAAQFGRAVCETASGDWYDCRVRVTMTCQK